MKTWTKLWMTAALVVIAAAQMTGAPAMAEESTLGTTLANDGGTAHNQYTSPPTNTFLVPQNAKITVWCEENSFVCVNQPLPCTGAKGIPVPVGVPVTSSCNIIQGIDLRDGGTYAGCVLANAPNETDGGVVSKCNWFKRFGNEGP